MSIIVKSLSYIHPDKMPLFSDINFSILKGQKAAIVGDNGIGKSTLLKIIAGLKNQSEGKVILSEKSYYIPQHTGQYDEYSIAQALGINKKTDALHAILNGETSSENFTILDDDWEIEDRIKAAFSFWEIHHLKISRLMKELSGGEKTKVFLSGILIHSPQIILLDEPSNHLDSRSRMKLYDFLEKSKCTILCVSHDKTLLNLLDTIFELSRNSITTYGGNYEFYKEEREKKLHALGTRLAEKEKTYKQTLRNAKEIAEKRQKQETRGKTRTQKKLLPTIIANSLKSKAEQSSAKLKEVQDEKVKCLSEDLQKIKKQIGQHVVLQVNLKASGLHKGKILIDAKNINFSYGRKEFWSSSLTFTIRSGDRICIEGDNGIGKTTLIKIITGKLSPMSGQISIADFDYLYIDQEYSVINNSLSLFEQVQQFNSRHLPEHNLKMLLHIHQFPHETWDKKCDLLSGGEKMKLILCCVTLQNNTPDMIILDEPTNNLDIRSQEVLTKSIKSFDGTVILISHDEYFKNEIDINKMITLK